jgi:translation initiation factor 2 alpha subunit (eIF-2alpha)
MESNNELEQNQIVLCTVDKILGTTVFVKIDGGGEGTLTTSEISPGRIRNLRDYVVPGKKIVCKILSIKGDKIYLSLRRVKQNEKKELLDKLSKDKSLKAILKTVLKDKSKEVIEKIEEHYSITDFFEETKENPKLVEKYTSKTDAEKILKILETKKDKPKEIKYIINLSSNAPDGINTIKSILQNATKESQVQIIYLAAGRYRISLTGKDFKEIKTHINQVLEHIEKAAKKQHCEYVLNKA